MEWTAQQRAALSRIGHWLKDPLGPQYFKLYGFAGTGKTTLARHIADQHDGRTLFAAFTGKAAYVLQQKGCEASTIHQLIYVPSGKSRERLVKFKRELAAISKEADRLSREAEQRGEAPPEWQERRRAELERLIAEEEQNLARPAFQLNLESRLREVDLLIVDECSMIDKELGADLLSFGTRVLAMGDPFQLPPVFGEGYFGERGDFMLTDIQRQARDNPIIEMSRLVREERRLPIGTYGNSVVRQGMDAETAMQYDQLLVGRNKTRLATNNRMRGLLGFETDLPEVGDRLVCLRNDHELGLLNGSIWNVAETFLCNQDTCSLLVHSPELARRVNVDTHSCIFHGQQPNLWDRKDAQEFDFGYALTVHKAQGSQWDKVMVYDEWTRSDHDRWLYTAITRAVEEVNVFRR